MDGANLRSGKRLRGTRELDSCKACPCYIRVVTLYIHTHAHDEMNENEIPPEARLNPI